MAAMATLFTCQNCDRKGLTEEEYEPHFTECTAPLREARLRQLAENPTEEEQKHAAREAREAHVPVSAAGIDTDADADIEAVRVDADKRDAARRARQN